MPRILHPEFLDELEPTPYPFGDTATLLSDTGYSLAGIFLDALLSPPEAGSGVHLDRVVVEKRYVRLSLADGDGRRLGECPLIRHEPLPVPDRVIFRDEYHREVGMLITDQTRISSLYVWEEGVHRFPPAATEFAARCCASIPDAGLQGFVVDGQFVSGDIWMVGSDGVVIDALFRAEAGLVPPDVKEWDIMGAPPPTQVGAVRFHVVGEPLFRRRLCGPAFETPRFLRELRVVAYPDEVLLQPDERGNVELKTTDQFGDDTILRVGGGLHIGLAVPEGD